MKTVQPILICAALLVFLNGCSDHPAEYISPSGFRPIIYKKEGDRITYIMLDVFSEDGPFVKYITKQQIAPGGPMGGTVNYSTHRADCEKLQFISLGEGDTVQKMMKDPPENRWVDIVNGSSATAALVVACQVVRKLK